MSAQLAIGCPQAVTRKSLSASTLTGLAIGLLVVLVFADARVREVTPAQQAARPPVVGTFTGTYADGLPIYRLPAIGVTAQRETR